MRSERQTQSEHLPLLLPRAVLFDMDGTLTEPMLDFPRIKREMGIDAGRPILEAMEEMNPSNLRRAEAVLERHEEEAARGSTLNPGCREVLAWLEARSVGVALITRNSRSSVATVLKRHELKIDVLIAREDAAPKPDPLPLWLACERLGISAGDAWMVGDGQYDIEAGTAAGIHTIWVRHRRQKPFAAEPAGVVDDLWELLRLLERCNK